MKRKREKNNEGALHATATQPPQKGPWWGKETRKALRPLPTAQISWHSPSTWPGSTSPTLPFRKNTRSTEKLTEREQGLKNLGNNTNLQWHGALNIPRSVHTVFFSGRFLWDMDCQCFRKGPVVRSCRAKQWGHIWNPASDLRLLSGSS